MLGGSTATFLSGMPLMDPRLDLSARRGTYLANMGLFSQPKLVLSKCRLHTRLTRRISLSSTFSRTMAPALATPLLVPVSSWQSWFFAWVLTCLTAVGFASTSDDLAVGSYK